MIWNDIIEKQVLSKFYIVEMFYDFTSAIQCRKISWYMIAI